MQGYALPPGQTLRHPTPRARACNIVLFVLMFVFWIIWLAGIGATQAACQDTWVEAGNLAERTEDKQGLFNNLLIARSQEDCGMELSIEWWVLFFELLCITCGGLVASGTLIGYRFESTFLSFMCINTGLMVVMAPRSVTEVHRFAFVYERYPVARSVTAAGNVGLLVLNFVYIIIMSDKGQVCRPTLRPGLPPMPGNGNGGSSSLPVSTTNPYFDNFSMSKSSEVALANGPKSDMV